MHSFILKLVFTRQLFASQHPLDQIGDQLDHQSDPRGAGSIRSPICLTLTTYPALAVPAPSLESCFQLHCNRFKLLRVLLEYFLFTHHFHSLSFDITFYLLVIIQKHPEAVKWEWLFLQTLGKCARVEEELSKTDSGTTKCAMTALNKEGKWSADDCNNTKPFFCYDGEISK